jgi:hypothetical protein
VSLWFGLHYSCEDFLNNEQKAVLCEENVTPENVDIVLLQPAIYSNGGNDHYDTPFSLLWPYGNVRSDDAYKEEAGQ